MISRRWPDAVRLILILAAVLAGNTPAFAGDPRIAVLYPQSTGGYKQVFSSMLEGVQENPNVDVISMEFDRQADMKKINAWLLEHRVDSIITLGSHIYANAGELPADIPVTVGALVLSPDGYSGISLAGDPALFLEHLQTLAPGVKRVFVIYSEKSSGWLVNIARENARRRGIELVSYSADSVKQGLQQYDRALEQLTGATDAFWIPLDTVVPDKLILPKLLNLAWDRNFVVFSNNPLHAKKGVLFALYPDHKKMGYELGKLAIEQIATPQRRKVLPARNLKLAVNRRTASHLGISYTTSQQREFDLVFPSE